MHFLKRYPKFKSFIFQKLFVAMSRSYKLITLTSNTTHKIVYSKQGVDPIHPPIEIRTDHGNETSIYILNIYLFLTLVS